LTSWLIDTGPLVAYLDSRDPDHAEVARRLDRFEGRLATTSAGGKCRPSFSPAKSRVQRVCGEISEMTSRRWLLTDVENRVEWSA